MPTHGSPFASRLVLVVGDDDRAAELVSTLTEDSVETVQAESTPGALATIDTLDVAFLVVVDGVDGRPADVFGAAARKGQPLPGVFVGAETRQLPPGVEQVPNDIEAAAATVRQRLLTAAAEEADPVAEEKPLQAFSSTVSHELRNHLGAARLAVESLDGPTTEQALTALDRLETIADEAESIAEKEPGEETEVTLSKAVEEAADRVRATNVSVDVDAEGTVLADRSLLTLLVENLLRNAAEHGGDEVNIRVVDTSEGFAVVDDGPGFEDSDPFAWGYTTGNGQGAGLAIVRRIAETHDWDIAASNEGGARVDILT